MNIIMIIQTVLEVFVVPSLNLALLCLFGLLFSLCYAVLGASNPLKLLRCLLADQLKTQYGNLAEYRERKLETARQLNKPGISYVR